MRHSFSSRYEVAHLWAHQLQDSGYYCGGNFYFDGDTIYSYGTHFPCGRIVYNRRGDKAYIVNSDSYSNTTAKHLHEVRGSIPSYETSFEVSKCSTPDRMGNSNRGYVSAIRYILSQLETIIKLMGKEKRSRTHDYTCQIYDCCLNIRKWIKFWDLDKRQKWLNYAYNSKGSIKPAVFELFSSQNFDYTRYQKFDMAQLIECWNLYNSNRMFTDRQQTADNPMRCIIQALISSWFNDSHQQNIDKRNMSLMAAIKRSVAAKKRKEIQQDLHQLEKWHNGDCYSFTPSQGFENKFHWHTALRLRNDMVETSKGIKLDLKESRRLWIILSAMEKSGDFKHELVLDKNGNKWAFNSYNNHILHAGCHIIPFSECQRIANQMGW